MMSWCMIYSVQIHEFSLMIMYIKINLYCLFLTDATVYVGGLDDKVTEAILWELFLQAGPVGMLNA